MPDERRPATLLRFAAFLTDVLLFALVLILPATLISWLLLFIGQATRPVNLIWWLAILTLFSALLLRDAWRGRSPGKRLFGLHVSTPEGTPCEWWRSLARNVPLLIPLWNLVELWLVVASPTGRRTGDRLARTLVVEE